MRNAARVQTPNPPIHVPARKGIRARARGKEKEVKEEEKTQHCDAAALQARYHHTGAAGPKPVLKKLKKKTKKMRFFDADVKLPMQSRV